MLLLGILLLVLLLLLSAAVLAGATDPVRFTGLGLDVSVAADALFVLGIAVGLVTLIAVVLVLTGATRSARRRREVQSLRRDAAAGREARDERDRLAAEREALEADKARLEAAEAGSPPSDAPADAPRPAGAGAAAATDDERLAVPPDRGR